MAVEPERGAAIESECEELRALILEIREENKKGAHHLSNASHERHVVGSPCNVKQRRVLKGHYGKVYCFAWNSDSERLVSASQDGKLIIWNGRNAVKIRVLPLRCAWIMSCAYSPNRKLVACGGLDNMCTLFDVSDLNTRRGGAKSRTRSAVDRAPIFRELVAHQGYLSCCRFISDEEIVTASGDTTCILWDIETDTPRMTFTEHVADVMSVAAFPQDNGNVLVTGSCDNTSKVFDKRAGPLSTMTFESHDSDVNAVQCWPAGHAARAFGSGSDDSSCRIYDLRCRRDLNIYGADHILCGITSIDFSLSGRYLFAGYDDLKCVAWDTLCGEIAQTLEGHGNRVSCVEVSQSGKALCTGSWDSTLKIWA